VGTNTGSGFSFNKWATLEPAAGWTFLAGNFAGDSKLDVVGYHPSNGTLHVGTNTGSAFSFDRWATVTPEAGWTFLAGNFAGDSKLDVVGYHPSNGTLWVGTNIGSGFDLSRWVTVGYKTLVLSTHPEYWSVQMYSNLKAFLKGGGSLLYLGGNGIYENGEYTKDQTGMVFRAGVENFGGVPQNRAAALFRRLDPPRPERALLGVATERCGVEGSPYQVQLADHPFFRGTDLGNGSTFGDVGLNTGFGNGKASAWEVDTSNGTGATSIPTDCASGNPIDWPVADGPGLPEGLEILATGQNWLEDGQWKGAEMVYYAHPGGGFVFSAGSITFGGSLVVDPKIQQIVRNALAEAGQ